jgi:hypothetical protein
MTTSIFQFAFSADTFAPSDMADTPVAFAQALRAERDAERNDNSYSKGQQKRHGTLERNALICAMIDEGHSGVDVGKAFGLTRERVRQLYQKSRGRNPGRRSAAGRDIMALIGRIRSDRSIDSWQAAEVATGIGIYGAMRSTLRELGLDRVVTRLFRWRRLAQRRTQIVDVLHAIARETGRNPRMLDLFTAGIGVSVQTLYRTFPGGFPEALELAGLPQNPKGRPYVQTLYDQQRVARGMPLARDVQRQYRERQLTPDPESLD